MTIWCQVMHDGVPAGPEYPLVPAAGVTDGELLDIKERSAREKGWAAERNGPLMHCWKEYPGNSGNPGEPDRVDRYFEIRGS